jgi:hypothetical protein
MNDINKRLCELLGKPHREIVDWEFFSPAGRIDLLKRMHIKGCLYEFLARYNFAADFSRDLLNDDGALARAVLEFLEKKEEEPELRRHRLPGEFDDWPSNAQMEYFKRGGR